MQNAQAGMFLGRRFYPSGNVDEQVFNSGGAGYILDRHALQALGPMLDDPKCFPHQVGFWEDVNIANCLRKSGTILPHDTRDGKQRERFHPFTPGQHLDYRIPKTNPDWYPKYNPWLKEGYDCCAPDSISFHYSPAETTRQLHTYLYHCDNKHNTQA
jgi:glycoprotein-N-acetylgalactosamine 3-beta-galactosyltransferase